MSTENLSIIRTICALSKLVCESHVEPTESCLKITTMFFFPAGFFDRREFILAQHPLEHTMASFWQMAWEQDVHLLVMLSSIDGQECTPFWPDGPGAHAFFNAGSMKMKVTLMDELDTAMWKAMRLSLEVRGGGSDGGAHIYIG